MSDLLEKENYVAIGKIVGTHGIKGTSKVYPYTESADIYQSSKEVLISSQDGRQKFYTIHWAKAHSRVILLSLQGITDREQAEALVGSEVYIPKASLPRTEADEYYWFDLIGLAVVTHDGRELGKLESIMQTGSNDVYVVKGPKGGTPEEILIPALASVVLEIDIDAGRMTVRLPDGLDE